ncbi:hypothetical protein LCGC14_1792110, partial [marine sediment metagenome]
MKDNENEKDFVGYIIGEASTSEFEFVTNQEMSPMKWEYLLVKSSEKLRGKLIDVEILAQISEIYGFSKNVTIDTLPSIVKKQIEQNIVNVKVYGKGKVLGYIDEGSMKKIIRIPRKNRLPGEEVFIAPEELLKKFFSKREEQGLLIGSLITNLNVNVYLDPNGLNRHLAIIAQTGAGKSYTTGVIIEELYKLGGSILIIDPHSDYVFLSQKAKDLSPVDRSNHITVFRNPSSTGRYGSDSIPRLRDYEINFGSLDIESLASICGIPSNATRIMDAIRRGLNAIDEENFPPQRLIHELNRMMDEASNASEKGILQSTLIRVQRLLRYRVFGNNDVPINELLRPWSISVVDLSGLNDKSMNYVTSHILNEVYNYILNVANFPIFIIIEEAHKFIPAPPNNTFCSQIINTIAAEGRKFGLFLVLITQRPSKIHPDSLSQCNSQIIMKITNPKDQRAILESSERATEDLL